MSSWSRENLRMNFRISAVRIVLFALAFLLPAGMLRAQDPDQQQQQQQNPDQDQSQNPDGTPKPAARSPFPVIDPDQPQQPEPMRDDYTPLTGLQNATLGRPELRHSYWVPGLQFGSSIQSGLPQNPGATGWSSDNYFIGNLSLLKVWNRSELAVNYSGGGFISTSSQEGSGGYQQLALADNIQTNRWLFQVLDQFSYLPQSEFGYGVGTNLGNAGVGGSLGVSIPGLSTSGLTNQSVFASNGPVYSNTGVLQATYTLSQRSSVTLAGSYGMLRFVDPGNIDTDSILGSIGYNYDLSPRDSLGLAYRFSSFHYAGVPEAYGDHSIGITYGRRITGRLALSLFGGPEITTYRIPVNGSNSSIGFNFNSTLTYAVRDWNLNLSYRHSLSGGSGVLVGSDLNQVMFSASHPLGRVWSGNFNVGYARNTSLGDTSIGGNTHYNSYVFGAGANRPIGRNFYFGASYAAYISNTAGSGCIGSSCSTSQTVHAINLSLQWHTRPFVLD